MRQVRMLDLKCEFKMFADEVRAAVDAVLTSQQFVGGPAIAELEEAIRGQCGARHAVAVSSGTDALLCAMMAMQIGHGDEVIVPPFTFFATAGSVFRLGAKPVFVDIDPRTFNLDPQRIEAAITDRTKAIIAVHVFGQCADMDAIKSIAARHHLPVIEDAAQAIGATYNGSPAGSLADLACLSFYPTKNLGGFGEGGMILTNDGELARISRMLRNQGQSEGYIHERVGGNFRLDTMKAAILLVKLRYLDEFTSRRRQNAARYDVLLDGLPVSTPYVPKGYQPVYHQYTILSDRRDELIAFLKERGVQTGVYYAVPLHLQSCFSALGYRPGSLPVAERTCTRVLSLPCHPMLCEDDLAFAASCIREFFDAHGTVCNTDGSRSMEAKC